MRFPWRMTRMIHKTCWMMLVGWKNPVDWNSMIPMRLCWRMRTMSSIIVHKSLVKVRLLYGSVRELFDAKFSISNGEVF